ncbi:TonB-dependent receptor [Dysgonomonas sp. 25]|uniref:SusC/RagA family TonB-linked outer membrane protein n=1 Tax=Dysgonomonas sp. 25 TaxID=2302933 RepID=UPI0013D80E4F|nr:TonB-dependent receptor [Dysgonomonas sp. 25]NDV68132.1 TonB-dependent receptor [Dysgonomonas sp. 25]
MNKILYFLILFCAVPVMINAQSLEITGKVTDALDNSPLPGVTVQVQNKSATQTNLDGTYVIKADAGDIITYSFLGMASRSVTVKSEKVINIALSEDNVALDEVVVVGYGTVKKRDLSGSVSQIKTSEILKGNPSPSINQALQGRLAGVVVSQNDGAPGAGISIQVRGVNSFSTNTQPLYIVDGIPYDVASMPSSSANENNNQTSNALAAINPNDIESIEVLKDASATAIYGSRGANGVVLITTKKGEKGNDKIEFTSNFSVSTIGKKVKMLNPYTYANYINEQTVNSAYYEGIAYSNLPYSGTWNYQKDNSGAIITSTGKYNPSPDDFKNPGIYTDIYGNQTSVEGTDWQDEIYQTSFSQEYNLSISGGSDKGWHSFSGNFLDQQGFIKNSGYKRYSLRTNIGRRVRNWVELGMNISYTNSTTDFSKSNSYDYGIIRSALIFPPTYASNVGPDVSDELNWLASNPSIYVNTAKDQLKSSNIFSSSYAELKFTDYLKFRQNLGLGYSNNNRGTYYNRHTQEGRPPVNGRAGQSDSWWQSTTAESIVTFSKTFKEIHSVNAVAGFTYEQSDYGGKSITASNFPTDITQDFDISQGLSQDTPTSNRGRSSLVSLLGRVNYSYKGKYIATASFRRDGSSKFITGNKFANFASGALAWRVSDEEFIKKLNFFDNLKLRLSYGQTGNQGINSYQSQAYLATANYPYGGSLSSGFAEVDWRGALNPDLKWETTDQYNIGLDISILKGRLNFTADYYFKKTNDLLQSVSIPSSTGFANMWANTGWVKNEGLELSAKFYALTGPTFKWDIDANISFNKNTIGGLKGDQFAARLWYQKEEIFIQRNGKPIGAMFGFVEDGIYNNEAEVMADPVNKGLSNPTSMVGEVKYRDINGDGEITNADRVIIGDANPDYVFGITNNFSWKNFTLSFFLQGVVGNDIFNGNLLDVTMGNIGNIPVSAYNSRWTPENKANAKWPKAIASYNRVWRVSDRYVEDGSYVRLKNINIGYNFKPKFKGVDNLYIYASATNLFTITDYSWFDPDVNAFGGDASRRGVDIYSYPSSRTFSLGFKVDF